MSTADRIRAIHNFPPQGNGSLRVLWDVDGTVLRLNDAVLKFLNFKYGTKLTAKDCTEWNWPTEHGMTMKDFYRAIDAIHTDGFEVALQPYDEDTFGVLPCVFRKHDCAFLTGKHPKHWPSLREWFGMWWREDVPILEHPNGDHIRPLDKIQWDFDVIVDDNPDLAIAFAEFQGAEAKEAGTLILMNAPWNAWAREVIRENYPYQSCVKFASGTREVEGLLGEIEVERDGGSDEHNISHLKAGQTERKASVSYGEI